MHMGILWSPINPRGDIHNLKFYWFMGGFDLQRICQIKSAECRGKVFPDDNLLGRLWSRLWPKMVCVAHHQVSGLGALPPAVCACSSGTSLLTRSWQQGIVGSPRQHIPPQQPGKFWLTYQIQFSDTCQTCWVDKEPPRKGWLYFLSRM